MNNGLGIEIHEEMLSIIMGGVYINSSIRLQVYLQAVQHPFHIRLKNLIELSNVAGSLVSLNCAYFTFVISNE